MSLARTNSGSSHKTSLRVQVAFFGTQLRRAFAIKGNIGFGSRIYGWTVVLAVAFSVLCLFSLPITVSYDGFIYVDLADVLGSTRFPHDWHIARTPLFPLCLKFAFWLLGRQPLAAILVSTSFGLGGTLLLGRTLKRIVGPIAATAAVILLAFFPLFVAYQHFVLTEVGTAWFLITIIALLLWEPRSQSQEWIKAMLLLVVCAGGYYWRQAVLSLAPVVALLYGAGIVQARRRLGNAESGKRDRWYKRTPVTLLTQIASITLVPFFLAMPWGKYVNESGMRDVTLRQGMLRQALLPADHPYVGIHADAYHKAIVESVYKGNFYSGLRSDLIGSISDKIYSKPMMKPVPAFYFDLVRQNPSRYLAGLGRTLILYAGAKGLENENLIAQQLILSPLMPDGKTDGPPELRQIKEDFQQKTKPCFLQSILWALAPVYGLLLIVANLVTAVGLLLGIIFRALRLLILCGIPVIYMVLCAVVLASLDRYAFPTYPIVIANLAAVPVLTWQVLSTRFKKGAQAIITAPAANPGTTAQQDFVPSRPSYHKGRRRSS